MGISFLPLLPGFELGAIVEIPNRLIFTLRPVSMVLKVKYFKCMPETKTSGAVTHFLESLRFSYWFIHAMEYRFQKNFFYSLKLCIKRILIYCYPLVFEFSPGFPEFLLKMFLRPRDFLYRN